MKYKGDPIIALTHPNDSLKVPVDAVIINDGLSLVLKPGKYTVRVIDRKGSLIAEGKIEAN